MKLTKLTLTIALVCVISNTFAQSITKYIIIDELAQNIDQLISEFGNQSNVYVTDGFSPEDIEQYSSSPNELQIDEIHIYTATKPGAIVFSSMSVTLHNEEDWAPLVRKLSEIISARIVIHSEVVFTGEEGLLLKQQLEANTGLAFACQN